MDTYSNRKMKKTFIYLAIGYLALVSCNKGGTTDTPVTVKDPITISSPTPTEQITKVDLSEAQLGYVQAGNTMAFRFLKQMYDGKNLVLSPLSLQYALAMAANGAGGETLQEIIDFLGYGDDGIEALNAYNKKMLEQLPAVDLDVNLKVTDALLVNEDFPLLPAFQNKVQGSYYAAVDNMDFANPAQVAARINEWASRSTNGFIDKVLEPEEISAKAVAYLMNALYFKAKWSGNEYEPMFREYATMDDKFTLADGTTRMVSYMRNVRYHSYARMDGYTVLALPYANGKYNMYILLPEGNSLDELLNKLQNTSWSSILASFQQDAEVSLKLPKFDIENKFNLSESLRSLGVKKAFQSGVAEFNGMFEYKPGYYYWIEKVIQKARISVAEWGTEAAAVTVVEMAGDTAIGPGEEPKRINFFADHPFVYLIGESTSGAILFEGIYSGK